MNYLSVKEIAALWHTSERSVRNYCAAGRVPGAFLTGKTWNIPENAEKPERSNKSKPASKTLSDILKEEKRAQLHGGIYHKIQIELTYNSNHIEGSHLTHDQTRYIFETNTIGSTDEGSPQPQPGSPSRFQWRRSPASHSLSTITATTIRTIIPSSSSSSSRTTTTIIISTTTATTTTTTTITSSLTNTCSMEPRAAPRPSPSR